MSTEQDEVREKRLRILNGLLSKTKENGATEEEMMSAMDMAARKMQEWGIEDHELGLTTDRKSYVKRLLNLKYGNKWRWELANTLAWNVGVLALHQNVGKGIIHYYGREQPVEAGAMIAEYIIGQVEDLSKKMYPKDLTERRRFARGCATRVQQRINRSYNLTSDPRLPAIMKEAREDAKQAYNPNLKNRRSQNREESSFAYLDGFLKGDTISLKKETGQITN